MHLPSTLEWKYTNIINNIFCEKCHRTKHIQLKGYADCWKAITVWLVGVKMAKWKIDERKRGMYQEIDYVQTRSPSSSFYFPPSHFHSYQVHPWCLKKRKSLWARLNIRLYTTWSFKPDNPRKKGPYDQLIQRTQKPQGFGIHKTLMKRRIVMFSAALRTYNCRYNDRIQEWCDSSPFFLFHFTDLFWDFDQVLFRHRTFEKCFPIWGFTQSIQEQVT